MATRTASSFTVATGFFAMAFSFNAGTAEAYQVYLDGEDSEFRVQSGNWTLDKTGSFQGNYRFSAAGPGSGASVAVWDIDAIPSGTYEVEFYVDNGDYAPQVEFFVEHAGGSTVLSRSQSFVGAGWHSIGAFTFTNAGRVSITDNGVPAGKKAIADALRITYQGTPPLPPAGSAPPEVSIVVDDLGALNPNGSNFTSTLFSQAPQISYAIIPFLTYSSSVLQVASNNGIETMLHQPFQYIGQQDCNAGDPTRLYLCMTPSQIINTLNSNFNSVAPYVWGFNNHQGSRFSQHRPGLEVVMQNMKDRNFYYLDSRTISDSVAYDIAREKGILTAERDLFVDGTPVWTSQQLVESVGQRALYAPNYNHIMICHQRPETVPGLLAALTTLEQWGVNIRRLDHNLHYIVETNKFPVGASVEVTGNWTSTTRDMISHECFDGDALEAPNSAPASVVFRPDLPKMGMYRVFVATGNGANVTAAMATIHHRNGNTAGMPNMALAQTSNHNRWIYLGSYPFNAGTAGSVAVSTTQSASGSASADAVKFVYDGEVDTSAVSNWNLYQ